MTKYDIKTYYSAVGKLENLILVETSNRIDDIVGKISQKVQDGISTISVEITHNDEDIQSYTLVAIGNNFYDMYSGKSKILTDKTIMECASYIVQKMPDIADNPYHLFIDRKEEDDTYIVKSMYDESEVTMTTEQLRNNDNPILGVHVKSDDTIEIHSVNHMAENDMAEFMQITNLIKDDSIRLYARTCLRLIPDYVAYAPSGLDARLYPADNVAEGGLKRRILHTVQMMQFLTTPDYANIKFTQREIDMMIVACLFCDAWHSGWQEDYDKDPTVKFQHPRIAANALKMVTGIISPNTTKFITNCIESHMGQDNKSADAGEMENLPIPDTEFKYTVHLANFITKQQNLSIKSENTWYCYDDAEIIVLPRKTAIQKDDLIFIQNALNDNDSESKIKASCPDKNIDDVKKIWKSLLEAKSATQDEIQYVVLARNMFII